MFLKPVQHADRDLDDDAVVVAHEEDVQFALRRRVLADVVERHLDHAAHAGEVVGLLFVVVPAANHARVAD